LLEKSSVPIEKARLSPGFSFSDGCPGRARA
jgi:hypothetical protein